MQNRGNFVLNKPRYLINIDDADLCVYPKSISEKKKNHQTPPHSPKNAEKKSFNDASWFGGILPTD